MTSLRSLLSVSVRKRILKIFFALVVFQVFFNWFLPQSVSSPLTKPTAQEILKGTGDSGYAQEQRVHQNVIPTEESVSDATKKAQELLKHEQKNSNTDHDNSQITKERDFIKKTIDILLKNKPEGIPNIEIKEKAPSYFYVDIPNPTFNIEFLDTQLELSIEQRTELTRKHSQLKQDILDLNYPADAFQGKGVVMIGGGSFLGTALTSIRALREAGSQLPLQLMLTNMEEYDRDVCEVLLPQLNGKCLVMEEIVGEAIFKSLDLQKYELKVLGLFLSTFEEVLLLDADNLAVKDPDYILESKPYKEFGYIIWPDFWRQTISPKFYDIASVEIGEPIRKDGVPPEEPNKPRKDSQLADLEGAIPDSTCEAGQLAINKKHHIRSLIATLYYNLNGFKYYYWLLGQGAVGIGDKDTFAAGLTVFKEDYYFVKQRPLLFGYDHAGGWQDTTMVQYDPEGDYEYYKAARNFLIEKGLDTRVNLFLNWEYTNNLRKEIDERIRKKKPDVQFLHIHSPKFNALKNFQGNDYEVNGKERRQFGPREKIKEALPQDWELKISRISQWLACESKIIPNDWKEVDRSLYCNRIKRHVEWLIETSDTPNMAELKDLGV